MIFLWQQTDLLSLGKNYLEVIIAVIGFVALVAISAIIVFSKIRKELTRLATEVNQQQKDIIESQEKEIEQIEEKLKIIDGESVQLKESVNRLQAELTLKGQFILIDLEKHWIDFKEREAVFESQRIECGRLKHQLEVLQKAYNERP